MSMIPAIGCTLDVAHDDKGLTLVLKGLVNHTGRCKFRL